jgi:hypothetical protein
MNNFLKIINPENQNNIQKTGFFLSISLTIFLVFLHFPFNGYDSEHFVTTYVGQGPCPKRVGVEKIYSMTAKEISDRLEVTKKCEDKNEFQTKPILQWSSHASIVPWLSTIGNTAISIVFILVFGVLWIYVFQKNKNG